MCESVYIYLNLKFTCTSIYMFNGNLNSFSDLISTYNLSKLPNLYRTFDFVYTNIYSRVSHSNRKVWSLHMCESMYMYVRLNFTCISLVAI